MDTPSDESDFTVKWDGEWQITLEVFRDLGAAFYNLYHWHTAVSVADIGNVKCGATLQDSYAALRMVINELTANGKKVVILGGSHDVTLAQYQSYINENKIIDAVCRCTHRHGYGECITCR